MFFHTRIFEDFQVRRSLKGSCRTLVIEKRQPLQILHIDFHSGIVPELDFLWLLQWAGVPWGASDPWDSWRLKFPFQPLEDEDLRMEFVIIVFKSWRLLRRFSLLSYGVGLSRLLCIRIYRNRVLWFLRGRVSTIPIVCFSGSFSFKEGVDIQL